MIDFLNEHWWFAITLLSLLIVGDSYMTMVGAKLHKSFVSQYFPLQNGYGLNPIFEKEVTEHKMFTRKHLTSLLLCIFALTTCRLINTALYTALFEFFLGSFMLLWLYIDLGHIGNILYFQDIRKPNSLSGKIESSYWLSLRVLSFRSMSQAILFGIVAISTMRLFFWGGVVAFLLIGFRDFLFANIYGNTSAQGASK